MPVKLPLSLVVIFILGFALTACGGGFAVTNAPSDEPAQPMVTAVSVADTAVPPTDTPVPPTDTAVPPTETPPTNTPVPGSEIDLGMALADGDPLLGRETALEYHCVSCHVNIKHPGVRGPEYAATDDLPPVMERGKMRTVDPAYEGRAVTDREYVIESILSPATYTVPGDWSSPMPETYHEDMTNEELADILAWLETFSDTDDAPAETSEQKVADEILAIGDPERGREIFEDGGAHELYEPKYACATCHTLDGSVGDGESAGPSIRGIAARAGDRVPGLSAEEYIRQSIMDPKAYITESYNNKMNKVAARLITEEELDRLVAFLLTQTDTTPTVSGETSSQEIVIDMQMEIAGDGDRLRGKNAAIKYRCFGCHADDNPEYGPPFTATGDLPHILKRGELRIADPAYEGRATTNREYLIESIFLPEAYVLPGEWAEAMPATFQQRITGEELANIMAWIESLE